MAIVAFLYGAAIVLLLIAAVVWATSRQFNAETRPQAGTPPEEPPETPSVPVSIVEQLERQYRNSPSYRPHP
ncbi:hypothetical protein NW813_00810 [Synechococcus sp. R55.6]|jgi:hypothetical protein|uniref:DUF6479 family protein n=1 Tax=unclassified Synechococcus TaxID=2626047 RepID=UPI0039C327D5